MGCLASALGGEAPEAPEIPVEKIQEMIVTDRAKKEAEIRKMQADGKAGEMIEGTTIKVPAEGCDDKEVTAAAVQWMCMDEGREVIKGEVWGAVEGELEPQVEEKMEAVPEPVRKMTKDKMMEKLEEGVGGVVDKALDKMLEEYAKKADSGESGAKEDGPLSEDQVEAVTTSWEKVEALGVETVGVLLFQNIFKIAPQALGLFSFKDEDPLYESPKLKKHATGVVKTVGTAVAGLKDLGKLVPVLKALGKTHSGYGVKAEHFGVVGQALIETLASGLGDAFTENVKQAWLDVYTVVSDTMISGFPE